MPSLFRLYSSLSKEIDDIEIIFVEVKATHSANLSKVQKAIEYAISNKRIKFKTYKYDDETINKAKATLIDKYYKYM
ncbi:Holliday junction resolvase-like protein [Commensalibacter intestini]|uniref:Holliday junction resolvase-like protein n=1 Tax=Commensalibacter intestini TaxID=479936 RepID=UPI000A06429F